MAEVPDIFKKPVPKIFRTAQIVSGYHKRFEKWSPLLEEYCMNMGDFGAAFLQQFGGTGCDYVFDFNSYADMNNQGSWAEYDPSMNTIRLAEAAFADIKSFLKAMFHEGVHAVQYSRCASLHDLGYLDDRPLFYLSPLSQIRQYVCIEADAHAKDQLFTHLGAWHEVEDKGALLSWLEQADSVPSSIRTVAQEIIQEAVRGSGDVYDSLVEKLLVYYENNMDYFQGFLEAGGVFVSLDWTDLWDLGDNLGVSSFSEAPCEAAVDFSIGFGDEDQKARLERIEGGLGVKGEETLPRFGDVLERHGLTRDRYLSLARQKQAGTKSGP